MENVKQENRLAKMEQKLDNLITDVKEIKDDIKTLDNKYSGKWVETLTLVIAGGLFVSIMGGIFFLIVK